MGAEDVRTDQTVAFLRDALGGRRRVLEVGCGDGTVARRLAEDFRVTALDIALGDPTPADNLTFVERDFLAYDATEPFDAIVFTSSLHHITPLARALGHAANLLAPAGLLVVDDFDLEAPDVETLRWYYDTQELLVAAGAYPADRIDPPQADPVARWRAAHVHEPPLHTGAAMRIAICDRFVIRRLEKCAYLHRYIGARVTDPRGAAIARYVLATEDRRIADNVFTPVGLRIVAERL
jgi:SAM-dependent methyltransferase